MQYINTWYYLGVIILTLVQIGGDYFMGKRGLTTRIGGHFGILESNMQMKMGLGFSG